MENLIKRDNGSKPTEQENKDFIEMVSKSEFGLCITFKDGSVRQVFKKGDDIHLITHVPFFEFENEEELYEYLPLPKIIT